MTFAASVIAGAVVVVVLVAVVVVVVDCPVKRRSCHYKSLARTDIAIVKESKESYKMSIIPLDRGYLRRALIDRHFKFRLCRF